MNDDVRDHGDNAPQPNQMSTHGHRADSGDGASLDEKETGRIEALSDGVIAIAITLLIIEVDVPHVDAEHDNLIAAMAHQWPVYLAYATSFWSIGLAWIIHHHLFRVIHRFDHVLLLVNLLFLMVIAFVPHPTAIMAEYLRDTDEQGYGLLVLQP